MLLETISPMATVDMMCVGSAVERAGQQWRDSVRRSDGGRGSGACVTARRAICCRDPPFAVYYNSSIRPGCW